MPGPARASRPLLIALLALVVLVAGGVVALVAINRDRASSCGAAEHPVARADVPPVFAPPGAESGDPRLDRLVRAAGGWGLGTVVGAVGFDYGQWLSVRALPGGLLGLSTKRDPVLGVVAGSPAGGLAARWGIRQAAVQHAYDADDQHYLQLQLARHRPLQVSAYGLTDGRRRWCATVGTVPTRYGDPLATALLPDHDVVVVADAPGRRAAVARLGARSGRAQWSRTLGGVDRGDAAVGLGDLVVVGGRAAAELGDTGVPAPAGAALTALDAATGQTRWTWGEGRRAHVLGAGDGVVVVEQQDRAVRELVALGPDGDERWSASTPSGTVDAALRAGTVVLRTGSALVGLEAGTGRQRWRTAVPTRTQFFPYGFDLAAQPLLEDGHLLLGTTTGLRSVDLGTGRMTTYPLPTDGINTTYWPYQVAVSGDLLAVVTNTGAVVLRRE